MYHLIMLFITTDSESAKYLAKDTERFSIITLRNKNPLYPIRVVKDETKNDSTETPRVQSLDLNTIIVYTSNYNFFRILENKLWTFFTY